jgi:hypothetical protein
MTPYPTPHRGGATISADGTYRYHLWREWDAHKPRAIYVMLNPSTADGRHDDPTIRRCVGFAKGWGFGGIEVVNLYALRATDPREIRNYADPVGPDNDRHILNAVGERAVYPYSIELGDDDYVRARHPILVCAWGARGHRSGRDTELHRLFKRRGVFTHSIGELTPSGAPSHPLYLAGKLGPRVFLHDSR